MKILLVNNLYPPLVRGGAEQFTVNLVESLTALGHEVSVIATKPYFSKIADTQQIFYLPSLYYHLSELPKFFRLFWHYFNVRDRKAERKLTALAATHNFDLLITNNLQGLGLSLGQAARSKGIKWLHVIHDVQLLHPSGLLHYGHEELLNKIASARYQTLVKKNFGSPDLVISPSQWILELHQRYGFFTDSLATVLPHPYQVTRQVERSLTDICHFVYLGQIEEHKGLILLLDAFRAFCQRSKIKAQLTIAGDGQLLNLLKINYQNLPVTFLGRINHEQVSELFSQASYLVVPSLCYENWPTVIIEAGLAGLPVIASDLGGNQELIHNHDYLFVPTVDSLTNKLIWAATNRQVASAPVLPSLLSGSDYCQRIIELIN